MSIAVPLYGFGASGGEGGTLKVNAPPLVAVTITNKAGKTKTKTANADGMAIFKGLASGTWTVTITDGEKTATKDVIVTTDYSTAIIFNAIPEFIYTGDFEIVNNFDESITTSQGNWKIRFLTSGVLTFTNLNGAENGIDVFLVGGGGNGSPDASAEKDAGGGGGYTKTRKNVSVDIGVAYNIIVGGSAEQSSAFGASADGGENGQNGIGGNGGSGGAGHYSDTCGIDGGDGGYYTSSAQKGTGQGTTTREFGEDGSTLYSTGGTSKSSHNQGAANTGNGGDGCYAGTDTHAGGSGIVIIRNANVSVFDINITYPAGSTCTVVNGETVLTAPDTTGSWFCEVPNAGTWSITISNGEKTSTKNVTVSTDKRFTAITLNYLLELYKDGANVVDWSLQARAYNVSYGYSVTLGAIKTQFGEGNANKPIFYTTNKVDITDYKTLAAKFGARTGSGEVVVGISASVPSTAVNTAPVFTASAPAYGAGDAVALSVDVSTLTGEYYVVIYAHAYWAASYTTKTTDVYLV